MDKILFYDIEGERTITLHDLERYYMEDNNEYDSFERYLAAVYDATARCQNDLIVWKDGAAYTDGYRAYTENEITEQDLEDGIVWRLNI